MKPVAWMIIDVDNGKSLQSKESKFSEINIPLYTSPRELSDEEITEVLNDENIAEYHQGNWLVLPYAFARAILKKASEK
jgi:hypothetical protein